LEVLMVQYVFFVTLGTGQMLVNNLGQIAPAFGGRD
jgi:hypothetical protein